MLKFHCLRSLLARRFHFKPLGKRSKVGVGLWPLYSPQPLAFTHLGHKKSWVITILTQRGEREYINSKHMGKERCRGLFLTKIKRSISVNDFAAERKISRPNFLFVFATLYVFTCFSVNLQSGRRFKIPEIKSMQLALR